jgi:hypothetical protein
MNAITRAEQRPTAPHPNARVPTRLSAAVFALKAAGLRVKRRLTDLAGRPARLAAADPLHYPVLLAESATPLWSDPRGSEARMQFGKVENLRRAAAAFDRLAIPETAQFSFWRQLGRPSRRRGFVAGRMLKEGCLVASTGGGLCQISNALYDLALKTGCAVVERHAHSRLVPGSAAQLGRDATVAWNYVDLRFRAPQDMLLRVALSATSLTLRLYGREALRRPGDERRDLDHRPRAHANDCGSCGEIRCHRHEDSSMDKTAPCAPGRAAFLLDEAWPEFRAYVAERRAPGDRLGIPLDGRRWGRPRYAWPTDGFDRPVTATVTTLLHAWRARFSAANGPRVAAQLRRAAAVAAKLASTLTPDVTEVCVAQSLLPFLWRAGALGGRRVTVLMTRLPMRQLQARLDRAAAAHPARTTLADFRAPDDLIEAEAEALLAAERIVTPHALVASQFPGRAELLDWAMPPALQEPRVPNRRTVVFPGPSVARKGAYEVRALALRLDLDIVLLGSELEGAGFWSGLPVRHVSSNDSTWLGEAGLVVQPSLVEEQPRSLLAALAAGIPVIATPACGILPRMGVTLIPENDPEALVEAILAHTEIPPRNTDRGHASAAEAS